MLMIKNDSSSFYCLYSLIMNSDIFFYNQPQYNGILFWLENETEKACDQNWVWYLLHTLKMYSAISYETFITV